MNILYATLISLALILTGFTVGVMAEDTAAHWHSHATWMGQ